ncbi:MAG: hypothetical protein H3C28_04810 [Sphingomonadales bacterium]|nr:hypothetical protein [Sphingomonadales bacterium]
MSKNHYYWRFFLVAVLAGFIATSALAGSKEPALGEPRHIALEPMTVSVFRDSQTRGLLTVTVSLELADADDRERVLAVMPRLQDQFVMALTRLAANRVDVRRPLDIDGMAGVLQSAADRTIGVKTARVLVEGATVRRL